METSKKIVEIAEMLAIRDTMKKYPTGILSIVSDSFNLWDVCKPKGILEFLKEDIMNRDGKLVIRPDSGDPVDILCGSVTLNYDTLDQAKNDFNDDLYESTVHGEPEYTIDTTRIVNVTGTYYKLTEDTDWNRYDKQYYFIEELIIEAEEVEAKPEYVGVIELLWNTFGGTTNGQGYKLLDSHIGAIYGDSITLDRADTICNRLAAKGFASTNVVLGIGSYSMGYATRDNQGGAVKATHVVVNGVDRDIFKDPVTDDGTKKSARGYLHVYAKDSLTYGLKDKCSRELEQTGLLTTVYTNGELVKTTTLTEIREKINNYSKLLQETVA
jgi:nicotinamide phosphoribosyltransferase